jgi:hypothetical protein
MMDNNKIRFTQVEVYCSHPFLFLPGEIVQGLIIQSFVELLQLLPVFPVG